MPWVFNPFTASFDWTADLSGYVPYTGATADVDLGAWDLACTELLADTATFGDGTNDVTINFNAGNDLVMKWMEDEKTLALYSAGVTPFIYPGYEPILSVTKVGGNFVATQFYASPGTSGSPSECFAFWGGVFDEGSSAVTVNGPGYGAAGVFAYNAMQAQNARTYLQLCAVQGITETSGSDNLTVTDLAGAIFASHDDPGTNCTLTRTMGVWIKDGGTDENKAGVTNYGLLISDIDNGTTTNYSIYTGAGAVRFGGALTDTVSLTSPALKFTPSTPAALSGDVNDWNLGNKSFIRASGGAGDRIVTGIVAQDTGHVMFITNIGTTNKLSFANESASSSAANRIMTTSAGTVEVPPAHTIQLIYDGTTARWREMSHL